jgi:hypothetical protein
MKQMWRIGFVCLALQVVAHPEAEALVHGVSAITGFDGLGGIDWAWDRRSNPGALLEFNPRPTSVYHLGERVGADFVAALSVLSSGETRMSTLFTAVHLPAVSPEPLLLTKAETAAPVSASLRDRALLSA